MALHFSFRPKTNQNSYLINSFQDNWKHLVEKLQSGYDGALVDLMLFENYCKENSIKLAPSSQGLLYNIDFTSATNAQELLESLNIPSSLIKNALAQAKERPQITKESFPKVIYNHLSDLVYRIHHSTKVTDKEMQEFQVTLNFYCEHSRASSYLAINGMNKSWNLKEQVAACNNTHLTTSVITQLADFQQVTHRPRCKL